MVRENDMPRALHWDLADRLRKSLDFSDMDVQGMADFLECHRNTVGGWLNRRNKPFPASVQRWAQKTGVPYEWLRDGNWPDDNQSVTNDDKQISAALQHIADQLERS